MPIEVTLLYPGGFYVPQSQNRGFRNSGVGRFEQRRLCRSDRAQCQPEPEREHSGLRDLTEYLGCTEVVDRCRHLRYLGHLLLAVLPGG